MSGASRQKIDLNMAIQRMIAEIESVDNNASLTRSQKTKQMPRIATKFSDGSTWVNLLKMAS